MAATGQADRSPTGYAAFLPYASIQLRAVAFILDTIVAGSCFLVFFTIAFLPVAIGGDSNLSGSEEQWVWIVLLSFIPFVPLFFFVLWAWRGQSIGMMAVRIEVTDRDGEPLTYLRALARAFAWPLSMFPLGIGAATVFFDEEQRALHDMLAGTVVLELPLPASGSPVIRGQRREANRLCQRSRHSGWPRFYLPSP
jgi:uncharacterized RDD family membrane protein YckC